MPREIGPKQQRILGILQERGKPMTIAEILNALTPGEQKIWRKRHANLPEALARLVRMGLIRREGGGWLTADGSRRRVLLKFIVVKPQRTQLR